MSPSKDGQEGDGLILALPVAASHLTPMSSPAARHLMLKSSYVNYLNILWRPRGCKMCAVLLLFSDMKLLDNHTIWMGIQCYQLKCLLTMNLDRNI